MKTDVTGEILQQRSGVCSICKCRGAAGWRILLIAEYVCLRPSWSIVMVAGLCSGRRMENKNKAEELTNRMGKCTPELEVKLKLGLHDGTANQNQSLLSV